MRRMRQLETARKRRTTARWVGRLVFCLLVGLAVVPTPEAAAQVPGVVPGIRPGDIERDVVPEQTDVIQAETPVSILPPLTSAAMGGVLDMTGRDRVFVKSIVLQGNTVLSDASLAPITGEFVNRNLGVVEILELRDQLTKAYTEAGYATSGAILPEQAYGDDGTLTLEIVEGRLGAIEIKVDGRRKPAYFRKRIELATGEVLNVRRLELALQNLKRDPQVERLQSSLVPTETRGVAALAVVVEERSFFGANARFDNYRSPSIGSLGAGGTVELHDLVGHGDEYRFSYTGGEGLNQYEGAVGLPLTAWDTKFSARFQYTDAEIVDRDFNQLGITSEVKSIAFDLEQPLWRTHSLSVSGQLTGDWSDAESKSDVAAVTEPLTISALRAGLSTEMRWPGGALVWRSLGSFGINALDATRDTSQASDGRFFSWLNQLQSFVYVPRIGSILVLRADAQWSPNHLPSLERFAIGGRYSVRGYRENSLVKDNGVSLSAELRVPVYRRSGGDFRVEVVPFVDWGRSWDNRRKGQTLRGTESIVGAGLGLRARLSKFASGELMWARNFTSLQNTQEPSIQDDGVHFQLSLAWP